MLVDCQLAGLSALGRYCPRVKQRAQCGGRGASLSRRVHLARKVLGAVAYRSPLYGP